MPLLALIKGEKMSFISSASVNADGMLRPHLQRTKRELRRTYQEAMKELRPLSELPEELESFISNVVQIRNGDLSATGLSFQGKIISVGHIAKNCALNAVFQANQKVCTLIKNGIDADTSFDCAIFEPQETNIPTAKEFYPLAEESILLVMLGGKLFWRSICVDVASSTFGECTAPGYSGAIVISKNSWEKWGVSGIHVGEGRILDSENLTSYLALSEHTSPCCFPHTLPNYDPQVSKRTPPANVRTKNRPTKQKELQNQELWQLEQKKLLSDHVLYGTPSNAEANFADTKSIVGRHFAYSKAQSLQIAKKQLSQRKPDFLTVVDGNTLQLEKLTSFIDGKREEYSKNKGQKKESRLVSGDASTLGIKFFWQFKSDKGEITDIIEVKNLTGSVWKHTYGKPNNPRITKEIETTQQPRFEVKFEEGLSEKESNVLYMSHFVINELKK